MGRVLTDLFKIDGVPMFAPDEDMDMQFNDLDAPETGRDETGFMHRIVVLHDMGTWSFLYETITEEERNYINSLFAGKADFVFTHPGKYDADTSETCIAYRSNYGIQWRSKQTGEYKNFKFNIIESGPVE